MHTSFRLAVALCLGAILNGRLRLRRRTLEKGRTERRKDGRLFPKLADERRSQNHRRKSGAESSPAQLSDQPGGFHRLSRSLRRVRRAAVRRGGGRQGIDAKARRALLVHFNAGRAKTDFDQCARGFPRPGHRPAGNLPGYGQHHYLNPGRDLADGNGPTRCRGLTRETRWWVDDTFMIGSLQIEAYRATKESEIRRPGGMQLAAYLDKLQKTNGLFFSRPGHSRISGAGATAGSPSALAEVLSSLPPDHPKYARLMDGYRKMMAGLKTYQAPSGCGGSSLTTTNPGGDLRHGHVHLRDDCGSPAWLAGRKGIRRLRAQRLDRLVRLCKCGWQCPRNLRRHGSEPGHEYYLNRPRVRGRFARPGAGIVVRLGVAAKISRSGWPPTRIGPISKVLAIRTAGARRRRQWKVFERTVKPNPKPVEPRTQLPITGQPQSPNQKHPIQLLMHD